MHRIIKLTIISTYVCDLRLLVPMAGVGICRNHPFSQSLPTSFSTVAIENLKINRESSHVLVKSGVVYYKPARTFFKVRLYMHAFKFLR